MKLNLSRLVLSAVAAFSAGIIGSVFTAPAINGWYRQLVKPEFNPPNWVFGPVWTILYFLMGIALYLVWNSQTNKKLKKNTVILFFIQLFLNAMWSLVFFGLQQIGWAVIVISLLWICIVLTMIFMFRVSRWAFIFFVPYLFWVSFAAILNIALWRLN